MTDEPQADAMAKFCDEYLPQLLVEVCDVPERDARAVGRDVHARAEALAGLRQTVLDTCVAPFREEVFDHEPLDASIRLKSATTVAVRNSSLEDWHVSGHVKAGGLKAITTMALGPLSHLLAARRLSLGDPIEGADVFTPLADRYPRAWACLEHLHEASREGGRAGYRPPPAPVPNMPSPDEVVEAETSTTVKAPSGFAPAMVLSAIDPRFDQTALSVLQRAVESPGMIVTVSALSRFSRNHDKLLRMLEILLAHNARILTTNCLLRNGEVHVRRGSYIKPHTARPVDGLRDTKGLSGVHRKVAQTYLDLLDTRGS